MNNTSGKPNHMNKETQNVSKKNIDSKNKQDPSDTKIKKNP